MRHAWKLRIGWGFVLLGAIGAGGCRPENEASSAPDSTMAAKRSPHVIFISVDTLRADHLGCYGYQRDTSPHIDKLARLKYFLAGEPDSRAEIVMTEQTETVINTLIDVVQKVVKDQKTRNEIADGLIAAFNGGEGSRGAQGSSYTQ